MSWHSEMWSKIVVTTASPSIKSTEDLGIFNHLSSWHSNVQFHGLPKDLSAVSVAWAGKRGARFCKDSHVRPGPRLCFPWLPFLPQQLHTCPAEAPDQSHWAPSGCPETNQRTLPTLGALPGSELVNNSPRKQLWNCCCLQRVRVGIYRDFKLHEIVWEVWICSLGRELVRGAPAWTFCWSSPCAGVLGGWDLEVQLDSAGSVVSSQSHSPHNWHFPVMAWEP